MAARAVVIAMAEGAARAARAVVTAMADGAARAARAVMAEVATAMATAMAARAIAMIPINFSVMTQLTYMA